MMKMIHLNSLNNFLQALIETKVMEPSSVQAQLIQQEQQVKYIIQPQPAEGDATAAGQEMNVEVPMEMQDYFQIVTGEDGNQYCIAPQGIAGDSTTGFYQIQTEVRVD